MNSQLVWMPPGEFYIGESPNDKFCNDTERPRVWIKVEGFWISKCPVTVGEFRQLRPEHGRDEPDDWPVVMVSWVDAVSFFSWLGEGWRLPSEAEWEYACRAGSVSPFYCGETITEEQANFLYSEDGKIVGPGSRTPVGKYPPNGFGLSDMVGNVNEWTADHWFPSYIGRLNDCRPRFCLNTNRRVIRGGAWDYMPRLLRSSWRDWLIETNYRDNIRFRVARSIC